MACHAVVVLTFLLVTRDGRRLRRQLLIELGRYIGRSSGHRWSHVALASVEVAQPGWVMSAIFVLVHVSLVLLIVMLLIVLFLVLIAHHLVQVRVVDSGLSILLWTFYHRRNIFELEIMLMRIT